MKICKRFLHNRFYDVVAHQNHHSVQLINLVSQFCFHFLNLEKKLTAFNTAYCYYIWLAYGCNSFAFI